jgi:helix-turn-helix, Psq domain
MAAIRATLPFESALDEIRSGALSVRAASAKYGIPRTTLLNHKNNPNVKKNGRPTVLSEADENIIADLILTCSEFKIHMDQNVFAEALAEAARDRGELSRLLLGSGPSSSEIVIVDQFQIFSSLWALE